jgi:ABC-type branched-subunit amino acid transport system ATPase component
MSSAEANGEKPSLQVEGLTAGYSEVPVINDVDLALGRSKVAAVVGPNGAGKSTLLKAILGLNRILSGRVTFLGKNVTGYRLERLARMGIGYVPQIDDVFEALRVSENLDMGGYLLNPKQRAERMEKVLEIFPVLKPRLHRFVETLSGGERKMTAIARVLMLEPQVLVLDEPTASLSPELSKAVLRDQVRALADLGHSILLVEQKAVAALEISDWAYVMVRGKVVMSAIARDVLAEPDMREIFLGGSTTKSTDESA